MASESGSPIVSSPLIMDDMMICATFDSWINNDISENNYVFSLHKNDGNVLWKVQITGDIF
jgi:eukaryotic-like serine/threonine-protein kinase